MSTADGRATSNRVQDVVNGILAGADEVPAGMVADANPNVWRAWRIDPAEHAGQKRPRRGCAAERCWCKWIKFHQARANAKLKRGGAGA